MPVFGYVCAYICIAADSPFSLSFVSVVAMVAGRRYEQFLFLFLASSSEDRDRDNIMFPVPPQCYCFPLLMRYFRCHLLISPFPFPFFSWPSKCEN